MSTLPAVLRRAGATATCLLLALPLALALGPPAAAEDASSLLTWIKAGFQHILPLGLDHICFILGLFFLQPKWRPLLWQTSAFTLAHSITLALVVLGFLRSRPRWWSR